MWTIFYRNIRLTVLVALLAISAGVGSFLGMPRKEDPTLTQRFALVVTRFDGAGAAEVESLITEPVEEAMEEIEEVSQVLSTSRFGISVVDVELRETVVDVERVWSEVRDALSETALAFPAGASSPIVDLVSTEVDAFSMVLALTWNRTGPAPNAVMARLADELSSDLRNLSGTRQVERFGVPREEVLVELRTELASAIGLDAARLAAILKAADARQSSGQLNLNASQLRIDVGGEFESLDRIRRVPVGLGVSGEVVHLEHIATIRKTVQDPPDDLVLVQGERAIAVAARARPDVRIDEWAKDARAVLQDFQQNLPVGVNLEVLFDQSRYVEDRLDHLLWNLCLGAFLVLLLTSFMLGARAALLVGAALPLVCLSVFAGLNLLGVPLHQMSISGLVIALGLLIDNAIIVVDEVRSRVRSGKSPLAALENSVRYLALPLFGSTLTTVLAFSPLFLMQGPAGEFVGSIGISVVLAVLSSLVISLTLTASLAARWLSGNPSKRISSIDSGILIPRLTAWFERSLDYLLVRPGLAITLSLALPLAGFILSGTLKEEFFPAADRAEFQIQLKLAPGSTIDATAEAARTAQQLLTTMPAVSHSYWFVGRNAPKFYYNMLGGQDGDASFAEGLVRLADLSSPESSITAVHQRLSEALPTIEVVTRQFGQGPPIAAPVEIRLYGPGLDELQRLGEQVQAALQQDPAVMAARTSMGVQRPRLTFVPDHEELRTAGLDTAMLSNVLEPYLDGRLGGALIEDTERLPVRVRAAKHDRQDLARIRALGIPTGNDRPEAGWTPLDSLGRFELQPEQSTIRHQDGKRTISVEAFVYPGVLPSEVLEPFLEQNSAQLEALPPGYSYEVGGDSGERNEAIGRLLAPAAVLFTLLIAVLVLTFSSFRLAGLIVVVAVASAGLAMLALWLTGMPFGFMAIVGTMGLLGVAVNDGIVVLTGVRESSPSGDPVKVRKAVVHSTRHVLTTTMTTAVGFLPLIIDGGRFWPPLATAIGFGIVGATILALVFVPATYLLLTPLAGRNSEGGISPE